MPPVENNSFSKETAPPCNKFGLKKVAELLFLTGAVIIYIAITFMSLPALGRWFSYLVFLLIIWAALRFGQRVTALVIFAVSAASICTTLHGVGPFAGEDLIFLGAFILTMAMTGLFLSVTLARCRKAEKQFQASKMHTRLIFDSALDAVISIDINGIITEWNAQAEAVFGWSASEAMGKDLAEMILPPSYRERHKQGLSEFLRNGISSIINKRIEMEALTRSGIIIPVEVAITVQKNEGCFFTAFIKDLRVEKQVESVRGLLSAIVESSSDAIISRTLEGEITSWNTGAERLFGYSADEATNKNIIFFISPERVEEETNVIKRLCDGKKSEPFETVRIRKDGRPIAVSITISLIRDSSGKVIGASNIIRDITDRNEATRKLQAAHQYLNGILNHIPDPIFMKDRKHRLIGGNKAFWDFINGSPEMLIGKDDYDFFPKEEADHFWETDDKVFDTGEVNVCEEFFTDAKGQRHILSTKKAAFLDENNEQFLIVSFRDITELKTAEEKILKYTNDLERSNRELDDFAYVASHDLKEPLRGLQGFSRILLEDCADRLDDKNKQYLERIIFLSQRMNQLIEDLLYFSRLGRAELAIQNTDLNVIIGDIQKMMESVFKEKNVHVSVTQPLPNILCDKPGITEVLRNLITNAIKYNDKPEKIIEIGILEKAQSPEGPKKNVFYVKDNGIGIEPKFHQAIFQLFKRLSTSAQYDKGGTGVGLTFVKKIVERNKGRIWLESEPGKGSTFYFTFGTCFEPDAKK